MKKRMSRRAPEDRGAVITWHKQGLTPAEICRKTGFHHHFVTRWIAKYNDSGSLDDAQRAGRPRKLSKSVEQTVERKMRRKRRRSSRVIARELKRQKVCDVSQCIVEVYTLLNNRKPRDCLKLTSAADCSSPRPISRGTGVTWCLVTSIRSNNSKEATHDTTLSGPNLSVKFLGRRWSGGA